MAKFSADVQHVFVPQYQFAMREREAATMLAMQLLKDDIVEPAASLFNAPVVLVKKHNGDH